MIDLALPLKSNGGARNGIAPANLLDVCDVNGNYYHWSDRRLTALPVLYEAGVLYPALGQFGLCGAFTDGDGKVVEAVPAGNGPTDLVCPLGATRLQLGTNNLYFTNTYGSFTVSVALNGVAAGDVAVPGSSFPWNPGFNPAYAFGDPDLGDPPVVAISGLYPGDVVTVTYISGTVYLGSAGTGTHYDANGDGGSSGTTTTVPSSSLPAFYMPSAAPNAAVEYSPWILSVPDFTFHRSLQTDIGSFLLQNLSGDTLSRDFEKLMRRSALEGAQFVYRHWAADAQAAWLEMHGTLTIPANGIGADTVELKGVQSVNPAQEDTPLEEYCETCQLNWGLARCGSTQATECQYSFQSCQVVERIMVVLNSYEKNWGDAEAVVSTKVANRSRKV